LTLRLNGSTSGYTEIDAPAVAGNNTLLLPGGNGTADQALVTNGSGALSFADRGRMVLETAQASTSGTEVDFTDIPSWVKRVTVMFDGLSTSGSSNLLIQIGVGSVTTAGYLSVGNSMSGSTEATAYTTGFGIRAGNATNAFHGQMVLCLLNATSYVWSSSHAGATTTNNASYVGGGTVTLSGTLDRVRITTVNGTDTFDAGSINILYEG
jgi:hypothetical protein